MRKVQALMDRADSTTFEAERDSCLAKADAMMAAYAIEQFELDMAKPTGSRQKPEQRKFTLPHSGDWDLDREYQTLFSQMVRHVGAIHVDWHDGAYRVIGFPSDLDWLDWLYQNVRLHMLSTMMPKPNRDLTMAENIALLKETGIKWQEIYEKMVATFPDDPHFSRQAVTSQQYVERCEWWGDSRAPFEEGYWFTQNWLRVGSRIFVKKVSKGVGVWFTKVYTEHCTRNNLPRTYASPSVYRRSFIDGYMYRIKERLHEMSQARGTAAVGKELVLANREGDLKELLFELRPELRPHPDDCDCDKCHHCLDPKCERPRCKARRAPVKLGRVARYVEPKYDAAASRNGRSAANSADLMGGRNNVGSNKRELD